MNKKEEKIKKFNAILFRWFKKYKRNLPWRRTSDPYKIFVSEVMLQQTPVERVLTKYADFLKRFPNIDALAQASLGEVLRAWLGLGYNRRAKYVYDCAKNIVQKHDGKFPQDFNTLQEFPGIGRSTAAALCSFAFNQDEPMIDTNIRRIICRVFFHKKIPNDATLYRCAKKLMPQNKGKDWNWVMMDIGALLCKAKNHDNRCPLQKLHGKVKDFFYKKPQKRFENSDRYYRGRLLHMAQERNDGYMQEGLMRRLLISKKRCERLLCALESEGLIQCKQKRVMLPRAD